MDSILTVRFWLAVSLLWCLGGCRTTSSQNAAAPENIWKTDHLPGAFRTVAVAPVKVILPQESRIENDYWQGKTRSLLLAELARTEKFAVFAIPDRQAPAQGLGVSSPLPADWFAWLRQNTQADGVLLTELSLQRNQPPFQAYWKLRLLDLRTGEFIWAAEQLAENPPPDDGWQVAGVQLTHPRPAPLTADPHSPQSIIQHHLALLLRTLPGHPGPGPQEHSVSPPTSGKPARQIHFSEPPSSTSVPPTASTP